MRLAIKIFMVVFFWPAILGHLLSDGSIDWGIREGGLVEGFATLVGFFGILFMVLGTAAYWTAALVLCGVDMSWIKDTGGGSGAYPIIIPMRF